MNKNKQKYNFVNIINCIKIKLFHIPNAYKFYCESLELELELSVDITSTSS